MFGKLAAFYSLNTFKPITAGSETFTAPGVQVWTAPAGVTSITIECWGSGGGGGGGKQLVGKGAGGGGGGGYTKKNTFAVTPGNTYSVYVGAGGTGGTNSVGISGTWSYFKSTTDVVAFGGIAGQPNADGSNVGGAGAAISTTGDVNYSGGNGASGEPEYNISNYSQEVSSGTFTAITGTSSLLITANQNDVVSSQTDIGFTFVYGSATFSTFYASSNGFIVLGTTSPATNAYIPLTNINGTIAGCAINGRTAPTTGSVRHQVQGTAPSRIAVIQYIDYDLASNSSTRQVDFQIRLYEETGIIELIYQNAIAVATTVSVSVGIRGIGNSDFKNWSGATTNWATPTVGTANNVTLQWSTTSTRYPSNGRIFRFSPPTGVEGGGGGSSAGTGENGVGAAATISNFSRPGATAPTGGGNGGDGGLDSNGSNGSAPGGGGGGGSYEFDGGNGSNGKVVISWT